MIQKEFFELIENYHQITPEPIAKLSKVISQWQGIWNIYGLFSM